MCSKRFFLSRLQEYVFAVKESLAKLVLAGEKARDLRVHAEKKVWYIDIDLLFIKNQEASFDGVMSAVSKELFAAKVEYAALLWIWDKVISKLKTMEIDLAKSLQVESGRTPENLSMEVKQLKTEVARTLKSFLQISSTRRQKWPKI